MIVTLGFILFILIYQFAVGAREGYTWANHKQRINNPIISPRMDMGKGVLDYHAWRWIENLSIMGMVITGYFINGFWNLLFLFIGANWFGCYAIYERVLNYICLDELFPDKEDYHVLNIVIPHSIWQDIAMMIIGLLMTIIFFIKVI
uniref:Uncharacterized protein n=1 Tax=viral metagenome TaxID=1070528 RepID=A0A6H1ZLD5_9ZZZZ